MLGLVVYVCRNTTGVIWTDIKDIRLRRYSWLEWQGGTFNKMVVRPVVMEGNYIGDPFKAHLDGYGVLMP